MESCVSCTHRLIGESKAQRQSCGQSRNFKESTRLQREHSNRFEFRLIEGVPHELALKAYEDADLVIDQILVGWYGAFAVEAMLMGKPVIARISLQDLKFLPPAMAKDTLDTFINAGPHDLYETLVLSLANRMDLRRKGEASLAYARKWHDPKYVAGLTRQEYERVH
jgi:hypothetical protein